ncbi:MAG: 4Fe-4S binding protein [Negativicutes bacterium]|nr:4Fe-4S binding protein [Negativicutes bacterium]
MVIIDVALCKGCGLCVRDCPTSAIEVVNRKARVNDKCVQCGICLRVCKFQAVRRGDLAEGAVKCTSCPVQCEVLEGYAGACRRYENRGGRLVRSRALETAVPRKTGRRSLTPLITAVGAGTNYPCCKPAPHIVQDTVNGVDVVTVVTEAPLSYSGVKVKIDTNFYIGEEGAKVKREGRGVGMVDTEEYGSKMLSIGGANLLTGKDGFIVARTIVDLANGERVMLTVENGAKLELEAGKRPVIDGVEDSKMRVGCGSATIGLFARDIKGVVDEAIILDHHVIGLFSEHLAGAEVGMSWSGVIPNARKSTRGRYFGEHGRGWGGTHIVNPRDAIKAIDMSIAKPGMTILVTETTGRKAALFKVKEDGNVDEVPLTAKVQALVDLIAANCEDALVSVIYTGGTGGSARAGVTTKPVALTRAVHDGKATLTIGGAPAYVLPGGGINFMVDTGKMVAKAFSWVPTPATVAPVEYTMTREDYEAIGGHVDQIKPLYEIKCEKNCDE